MGRHTLPELEEDPDLERWSPCVVLASVKLPVQVPACGAGQRQVGSTQPTLNAVPTTGCLQNTGRRKVSKVRTWG